MPHADILKYAVSRYNLINTVKNQNEETVFKLDFVMANKDNKTAGNVLCYKQEIS